MIGLKTMRGLQNQSDTKLKPIASRDPRFLRFTSATSSSDWLLAMKTFVLIGRVNFLGFSFTTLDQSAFLISDIKNHLSVKITKTCPLDKLKN